MTDNLNYNKISKVAVFELSHIYNKLSIKLFNLPDEIKCLDFETIGNQL